MRHTWVAYARAWCSLPGGIAPRGLVAIRLTRLFDFQRSGAAQCAAPNGLRCRHFTRTTWFGEWIHFIHHIDRGCTYAAKEHRDLVEAAGGLRSMSRKANGYDNAVAESIFRTIKEEGIGQTDPKTIVCACELAFSFIEGFYNVKKAPFDSGLSNPIRGGGREVGHRVKKPAN